MTASIFDDDAILDEAIVSFSDESNLSANINYRGTKYACSVAPETSRYYPTPTKMLAIEGRDYHVVENVTEKSRFDEILFKNNTSVEDLSLQSWEDLEDDKKEWRKTFEEHADAVKWHKELNEITEGYSATTQQAIDEISNKMEYFNRILKIKMNSLVYDNFFASVRSLKKDLTRENGIKLYEFVFPSIMFVNEYFYTDLLTEIIQKEDKLKRGEYNEMHSKI